jgi:hypothetical protein
MEWNDRDAIHGCFSTFAWRKATKTLSQDSLSPGRDLNPVPPEYEARVNHSAATFGVSLLGKANPAVVITGAVRMKYTC